MQLSPSTVRVLQNATNATKLAILLVTVGVREMQTIRGALGQARNLLALSVEFKDITRGNAQSRRTTKTVEIMLVMTGLQPK
ncbi:hypothetical protein Tco_0467325, partial [Tanacetum coccineum]